MIDTSYGRSLESFQRWTGLMHRYIDGGGRTSSAQDLCGAALGICGELGELIESSYEVMIFEAGDALSYVYMMAEQLMVDGSGWIEARYLDAPTQCYHAYQLAPRRETRHWIKGPFDEAVFHALRLAELTKKSAIQMRPIPTKAFEPALCAITQQLAVYLGRHQISVRITLEQNVQKLTLRHPAAAALAAEAMAIPRLQDHPAPIEMIRDDEVG